ncbi:hypothetical protein ACOME3_000268 [Neoechinorhynchus agilis]
MPKMDGHELEMEFDIGASVTVLWKNIWNVIGRPKLHPAKMIKAYGGKELIVKGECWLDVRYHKRDVRRSLEATVVAEVNKPLCGLPWIHIKTASNIFQRFIDDLLRNIPGVAAYMDDIIISSQNEEGTSQ